jgi:hypothetical protein
MPNRGGGGVDAVSGNEASNHNMRPRIAPLVCSAAAQVQRGTDDFEICFGNSGRRRAGQEGGPKNLPSVAASPRLANGFIFAFWGSVHLRERRSARLHRLARRAPRKRVRIRHTSCRWRPNLSRGCPKEMIGSMRSSWMVHPTHGPLAPSNADLTHSSGPPNLLSTAATSFETIMTTVNARKTTTVETSVNDCRSRRGDGSDNRGTQHWDLRQKRSEPFVSPPGPIDPLRPVDPTPHIGRLSRYNGRPPLKVKLLFELVTNRLFRIFNSRADYALTADRKKSTNARTFADR